MENSNSNAGTNVLLAIVLAAIVGFGVYYFMSQQQTQQSTGTTTIDVQLPGTQAGDSGE